MSMRAGPLSTDSIAARALILLSAVLTVGLLGCVDPIGPAGDDDDDGIDPTDHPFPRVDWEPCPLFTGGTGQEADCAVIEAPLDWEDPDDDSIDLFVKRIGDAPDGVQLWFLAGGPGGAGNGYEPMAELLTDSLPGLVEVILPDHRGTGRSTRLGCPQEDPGSDGGSSIVNAEWPACADHVMGVWGRELDRFSTTDAARDLTWLIDGLSSSGQSVHVHGTSYGSFWAQRYLQVAPSQADSVTLLGVVHPDFSFTTYGQGYETAGAAYMDACGDDPFCSSKLGADPLGTLEDTLARIDGGHCPEAAATGLNRWSLRSRFGGALLFFFEERVMIPALTYRLERCNADDVAALRHFAQNVPDFIAQLTGDPLRSTVINTHIALSELWEEPIPTVNELNAFMNDSNFAVSSALGLRLRWDDGWPAYAEDEYAGEFPDTRIPVLAINGELDPATPEAQARAAGEAYDRPFQHYVEVPGATHGWTSPTEDGWDCITNLMVSFALEPEEPPLACTDLMQPIDFRGDSGLAQWMFGRSDLYE